MKKSDEHILRRIRMFCMEIEKSVSHIHYDAFMKPDKFERRNSCSFALLQIGELVTKLSDDFKLQHNEVKWKNWSGVRNTIAHNYEGLDMKRAWNLCTKHTPVLAKSVCTILDRLNIEEENECKVKAVKVH